ncbi:hypothetical protein NHX12_018504 [Muraenolepis orangiensis]|uniref:Uncharacterized protein n=1 Tax=Muraenolepis orangiensis TaxID=630683 RepID=A0A9Q0IY26_9TELE|nr:hypothetical protein NHX12_018504 [Muraenolepis orangiensis]
MTTPHASACLALCLHASEDPNGNSFVSSSSSSSSSLPGETSPDLLSSPSGEGWADHHHMLEDMVRGKADALTDDTSTSLYLDARSGRTWSDHNDNVLIAISAATPTTDRSFGWHSDDMDDELSEGRGCSSPGSDATEVPADDDGDDDDVEADEEESLFLSLCSELSLRTSSGPQQSLPSEGPPTLEDSHCSLTPRTLTPTSSSSSSSTFTNQLSDSRESDVEVCEVCLKTNPLPKAPDRPGLAEAPVSTETKPANQEARRVRRPDLKNIKAKVVSRTTPSAAKLANRRQSVPAYQRRDVPRKEEVQVNREKGPSWASVGVKARPVPCFSIQSKERRRSSLAYGTLSVSSRSDLGSEVVVNNVTKTTPDTSLRQVSGTWMTWVI